MKRLLILSLWLAACAPAPPPSSAPTPVASAVPVEVARVERRNVDRTLELPGELRALREAELFARVAGYLQEVRADIGDQVTAGEVVAVVEARERTLESAEAEAQVGRRQAEAAATLSQLNQQSARAQAAGAEALRAANLVAAARAEVAQTLADQRLQKANLERLQGVYAMDAGLVPGQELDAARHQAEAAAARLEAARQQLAAAGRHRQALQAERTASGMQIQTTLEQARGAREHVRAQISTAEKARQWDEYREVRAPFSGVVVERASDPGVFVSPASGTPILALADVTRVCLRVGIPELESSHVERGTRVTMVADALPEQPAEGRVTRVAGALARATRTLEAEAEFPNLQRRLRPGMFVRATFALQTHRGVLAVPTSSLVREKKKVFVYVLEGGKALKTPVEPGYSNRQWTELLSGVEAHAQVVVKGQDKLSDGAAVEVRKPAGSPERTVPR